MKRILTSIIKEALDSLTRSKWSEECPECGEPMKLHNAEALGWEKWVCSNCGSEFYEDDLNMLKEAYEEWDEEFENNWIDDDDDDPYE